MTNLQPHHLLSKHHALFLGYAAPDVTSQTVECLHQPVSQVYPALDKTHTVHAIDSWISVYTSGILVQETARRGHKHRVLWFPIQNLYIAAALRYVPSAGPHPSKFEQISHKAAQLSKHPTIFSFASWREASLQDELLAYTFIAEREDHALDLVNQAELAFNNKSGWGRDGEKPPRNVVQRELMSGESYGDAESVTTANSDALGSDAVGDLTYQDEIFPQRMVYPYKITPNTDSSRPVILNNANDQERDTTLTKRRQPIQQPTRIIPRAAPMHGFTHSERRQASTQVATRTPPVIVRHPVYQPPQYIRVPVPVKSPGRSITVPVVENVEVQRPPETVEVEDPPRIQQIEREKPVVGPPRFSEIPYEGSPRHIDKVIEKIVEVPVFVERNVAVPGPQKIELQPREIFVQVVETQPAPIVQTLGEKVPVFLQRSPDLIIQPEPFEVPVATPYRVPVPVLYEVPEYHPVFLPPYGLTDRRTRTNKEFTETSKWDRLPLYN